MMLRRLVLLAVALSTASLVRGAELQTPTISLTLRDGVIVGLKNRLTGESLVAKPKSVSLPAGLHRMAEPLLRVTNALEVATRQNLAQFVSWSNLARFELHAEFEPTTGDVLLTQSGESTLRKLSGISWGIANVPDHFEVLVPGCSGQRFNADAPAGLRDFNYPMKWEASFLLIQGRKGGFLIRADDDPPRFKNLVVEHARHAFRLRFESCNLAPFADKDHIESSRWRITTYRGPWQTGAAIYRQWAEAHHHLVRLADQQPVWTRDIRFVVMMGLDLKLLSELAGHCDPARTLLYIPGWRRDGYDRNYPDYTAVTNFDSFITKAHRLGFRVMAHVNYFGCHPENPVYEQVKHAHMRDPFTEKLLWWEWPANPPIKFAYINPASRAWRELFVERMQEVVRLHKVDALHLDQTLCIYNDANGLVDGVTCIEGNLALHRELRAALQDVALSGEGLNEITCQYESFAQRHVWSMDHVHLTWDDRCIAMSHPVSSAVLTPYTQIYGYLGMPNPANSSVFSVWQRAYEPFGVLPTYNRPDITQLTNPPPSVTEVLTLARFFQQHLPVPDFDTPWDKNDLFVYRLADGGRAFYIKDNGVAFGWSRGDDSSHGKSSTEILTRRIDGMNVAKIGGSIPGWPAYDAKRIFGLQPKQSYPWTAQPRDLHAPHLSALPRGIALQQAGVHADFARFCFSNLNDVRQINLWDFRGEVTAGAWFADGTTLTGDALDFADDNSGSIVHPNGEGFFFHPPWRGSASAKGRPVTFIEFRLHLTKARQIHFESGVCLREQAVGKSDGVTFRAIATCGWQRLSAETHNASAESKPLRLDLTPFAGARICLRLEVDKGPANNSSFDWALMKTPRVVVEDVAKPMKATVRLAGLKSISAALAGTNQLPLSVNADGQAKLSVPLPGTLVLAFAEPTPVSTTCDLLETKFTPHTVFADGIETASASSSGGSVLNVKCGGQRRRALSLQPPMKGRSLADWLLRLPNEPVRLTTAVGIRDGTKAKGVRCEVQVNGATQFSRSLDSGDGWLPVKVDLARWRSQPVLLTFTTRTEERVGRGTVAFWGTPRLTEVTASAK